MAVHYTFVQDDSSLAQDGLLGQSAAVTDSRGPRRSSRSVNCCDLIPEGQDGLLGQSAAVTDSRGPRRSSRSVNCCDLIPEGQDGLLGQSTAVT